MRKFVILLIASMVLLILPILNALEWSSSGEFVQGQITFYYDESGIWNQTGNVLTPNTGTTINITGIYYGDGSGLTNVGASAVNDIWVNVTGDTMSGNLNMDGNKLTDVGELIMQGLITSYNVTPVTHNLYSIGNSTHWYAEAYITNLYAVGINASEVNSTDVNSDRIGADNLTIGTNKIIESNGNLVVILS